MDTDSIITQLYFVRLLLGSYTSREIFKMISDNHAENSFLDYIEELVKNKHYFLISFDFVREKIFYILNELRFNNRNMFLRINDITIGINAMSNEIIDDIVFYKRLVFQNAVQDRGIAAACLSYEREKRGMSNEVFNRFPLEKDEEEKRPLGIDKVPFFWEKRDVSVRNVLTTMINDGRVLDMLVNNNLTIRPNYLFSINSLLYDYGDLLMNKEQRSYLLERLQSYEKEIKMIKNLKYRGFAYDSVLTAKKRLSDM